jgi:DNA-binding transcriptional regulator LsrR (DeoR family)
MTVNITIELDTKEINDFENRLRNQYKVKDFNVLPDTSKLYDSDPVFRKILKGIKSAQLVKDRYINNNRDKV